MPESIWTRRGALGQARFSQPPDSGEPEIGCAKAPAPERTRGPASRSGGFVDDHGQHVVIVLSGGAAEIGVDRPLRDLRVEDA